MTITQNHSLSKEEAYKRIDRVLNDLQASNAGSISNPQKRWNSQKDAMEFSLSVMGFKTSGQIVIHEKSVSLNGTIPFLAMLFESKIKSTIKQQLEKTLS